MTAYSTLSPNCLLQLVSISAVFCCFEMLQWLYHCTLHLHFCFLNSSWSSSDRRGRIQSSSDRSRKRSRTPLHSRNPRDRSHSTERCQEWTRRSSSRDRDRRRRGTSVERIRKGRSLSLSQEREKGNGDGRSERPGRSSATRVDTSSRRHGRNGDSKTKVKTRAPDRDFLKLIPNFDSMVSKNPISN